MDRAGIVAVPYSPRLQILDNAYVSVAENQGNPVTVVVLHRVVFFLLPSVTQ